MATDKNQDGSPQDGRRARRQATEQAILEATRRLVERDGVLHGLNLQEVAGAAGVNRALIYQYFGSRRGLLRAALAGLSWEADDIFHSQRALPFVERRLGVFDAAISHRAFLKLETLVALDGGDIDPFPALEHSEADLERDRRDAHLPDDVDGLAVHTLTAATYLGYVAYREAFAGRLNIAPRELDARVRTVFEQMLRGIAAGDHGTRDLSYRCNCPTQ